MISRDAGERMMGGLGASRANPEPVGFLFVAAKPLRTDAVQLRNDLQRHGIVRCVGTCGEALAQFATGRAPAGIVVLTGEPAEALELFQHVHLRRPVTRRMLVLGQRALLDAALVHRAFQVGAAACVPLPVPRKTVDSFATVAACARVVGPRGVTDVITHFASTHGLTARETDLVALSAAMHDRAAIATALRVTDARLKKVANVVLSKIGCPRQSLALLAQRVLWAALLDTSVDRIVGPLPLGASLARSAEATCEPSSAPPTSPREGAAVPPRAGRGRGR